MTQTPAKSAIFDTLASHRDELRQLGVKSIGLFGSHLRGTARTDSDVGLVTERALKPALRHVRSEAAHAEGF